MSPPDSSNRSKALIVLGMHRSGTSALTGTLHRLGVALGGNLMPPIAGDNDRGFYENDDIVPVHERLFAALGSSWHDASAALPDWWEFPAVAPFRAELAAILEREFGTEPLWGIKDPRICRFLPLWLQLLDATGAEAKFLLIWRHPFEVAESLRKRQGFARLKSYLLWFRYMREAELGTRDRPRAILAFGDFLADWRGAVGTIAGSLDLPELAAAIPARAGDIDGYLSADLRRNRVDEAAFAREAPAVCITLLHLLAAGDAGTEQLDAVYADFDAWIAEQQPTAGQVADLKAKVVGLAEASAIAEQIAALRDGEVAQMAEALRQARAEATALAGSLDAERAAGRRLAAVVDREIPLPDVTTAAAQGVLESLFASRGWRAARWLRRWRSALGGASR